MAVLQTRNCGGRARRHRGPIVPLFLAKPAASRLRRVTGPPQTVHPALVRIRCIGSPHGASPGTSGSPLCSSLFRSARRIRPERRPITASHRPLPGPRLPRNDEADVRRKLQSTADAWNRADLAGHVAPYADSAAFMTGRGPMIGRDKIETSLRRGSLEEPPRSTPRVGVR
jgi:hypothetical protein